MAGAAPVLRQANPRVRLALVRGRRSSLAAAADRQPTTRDAPRVPAPPVRHCIPSDASYGSAAAVYYVRQMATLAQTLRRFLGLERSAASLQAEPTSVPVPRGVKSLVDIASDDPILQHWQGTAAAVDLDSLDLDSPARSVLRAAGMKLVVPLVSQSELIGLLSLGPRLSELDYSRDDRRLLENLAAQAAPAVRVAQLVRQQQSEVRARARIE